MLKSNKLLSPDRVRALMASMQGDASIEYVDNKAQRNASRVDNACNMILKTSCSIQSAACSWGVTTKKILEYAQEKGLPIVNKPRELDSKAREIVESGSYTQGVPYGLKHRVAYELALKVGVSEACRRLNVCRRGVYYFCERYNLPTPERSERRDR